MAAVFLTAMAGCGFGTDAATRLVSDIEAGANQLGSEDGATYSIRHDTPSKSGECAGPYKVQLDQVGAMIIWCEGTAAEAVSSHSMSYHARFVDTPQTFLLDKAAGETLTIELERRSGHAVITDVH